MIKIDLDPWETFPEHCNKKARALADDLNGLMDDDLLKVAYIRVYHSRNYLHDPIVYTVCLEPKMGIMPSYEINDNIEAVCCSLYNKGYMVGHISYEGLYFEVLD